jgi:signal transduction histidine kinase
MIDQILIYSRLEASKQPLRIEGFLVQKSFLDLKDTFNFLCQQKGVGITWNMPRDLPEVQSDPERLKEIASNLLQNGLKYTDRGSIDLSVSYLPHSDSLALEVTDTGLGIPQNYLSSIFEPFVQVHKTSTGNSRGGIGLGLSIVKKHVELLKGTINVKTEVGKGTIFTVILPRTYERQSGQHRALLERLKAALRFRSDSPKRVSRPPTALPQSNPSELVPPRRVVG